MSIWQASEETRQHDALLKRATPSPGVSTTPETVMQRFGRTFREHLQALASRDPDLFMQKTREWQARREENNV